MYALDLADAGSVAFNVSTEATKPPFVERVGIDLDEIREPLDGYKVITRMLPQVATNNSSNTNITVEFAHLTYQTTRPPTQPLPLSTSPATTR